jgi:hypothetical protein
MPWEVYEKIVKRATAPTLTISKLARLSFNAAATEILTKNSVTHILLLWDKAAHKIGIRAVTEKEPRSYSIHYAAKNANAGFAAKTFLRHINYHYGETKSFPCHWNQKDRTYEVDLPAESFIQRFPREHIGKKGSEAPGQAKATTA